MKTPGDNRIYRRIFKSRPGVSFCAFIVILAVLSSAVPAGAQGRPDGLAISDRPRIDGTVNPELILFEELIAPDTSHGRGYIPPALDMSYLEGMAMPDGRLVAQGVLPSSYMAPVSPVKDQTYFGTCWAFTTYGSLESTLLAGGDAVSDFSEKNLVNRAGFDAIPPYGVENTGGNYLMSTACLARRDGPVSEADDPYPYGSIWFGSPGSYTVRKHLRDVYFVPGISGSPPNADSIKHALMDYGAVYTSINTSYTGSVGAIHWNYNPACYAYYNPNAANVTDHAVTIVGWDDGFLAGNFTPAAPGNGAFIVKNSWGTGWGNNGYFYISYYDAKVGRSNAVFLAEQTTSADHIYQYDRLGLVGYGGYYYTNYTPCETNWVANVFRAGGDETVTDVSFYVKYPGTRYAVYIYTDPSPGNPASGTLAASQAGTLTYAGYNTIDIASPPAVGEGHTFSAIVKLTNPLAYYHNYNVPLCYADAYSLTSGATGVADVGYISADGTTWDEITEGFGDSTITNCLKAFTKDVSSSGPTLQFSSGSYAVNEDDGTVTLTVDKAGTTGETAYVDYATANGTALSGINYESPSPNPSTLSIGPFESSGTITIPILDDGLYGGPLSFTVTLSSPVNAQLGASMTQATVTIADQDPSPVIQFDPDHNLEDISEDTRTAVFTVMRSGDAYDPVTVDYATGDGTALAGTNYEATSGTLTFSKGVMSRTISVPVLDDNLAGPILTFNLTLSNPAGGAILGPYDNLSLKLHDTDPLPTVQFSSRDYAVNENGTSVTVQVDRVNDAWDDVTVDYATSDGTATAPGDYTATGGTLTFARGVMARTITIPVRDDGLYGPDLAFAVSLSNPAPAGRAFVGLNDTATVTLKECDPAPVIALNATDYRADEDGGMVYINVTRINDAKTTVSVRLATQPGTATSPADYTAYDGHVYFARGVMSQLVAVSLNDDGLFTYPDKQFGALISDPAGGAVLGATGTSAVVTLVENDPAPAICLESSAKSVGEDEGTLYVNILRANDSTTPVSVYWSTAGGQPGYNYTPGNGTVTFSQGEFTKQVQVPIIDDHVYSSVPAATFGISISSPSGGAVLKSPVSMTVYVNEADPGPVIGLNATALTVAEDAGSVTFGVTRVNDAWDDVTVNYLTANGSACHGANYANTSGTLTFHKGEMSKLVTIPVYRDSLFSGLLGFTFSLGGPAADGAPNKTAAVTVTNVDPAPVFRFSPDGYGISEAGAIVSLTILRSNDAMNTSAVDYNTSDGTALAGADYVNTSGTVFFACGQMTSPPVAVAITNDDVYEDDEVFYVELTSAYSSPSGATIGSPGEATVAIDEDDMPPVLHFEANAYNVSEDNGTAWVNVVRQGSPHTVVTVQYNMADGTAVAGTDYAASNGTLTFGDGVMSRTLIVPIFGDGLYSDVNRYFELTLSNATRAMLIGSNTTINLVEADPAPIIRFDSAAYNVNSSDGSVTINVTRLNDAANPVAVTYNTSDGTALEGQNYVGTNGTLTFGRGVMCHSIRVPIVASGGSGPDVTFNVTLSCPTGGATLGVPARAMVSINVTCVTFSYNLVPDWNLISVPLNVTDNTIDGFFPADVRDGIVNVWSWDESTQNWKYYSPDPDPWFASHYPALTDVEAGRAYWVEMTKNASFTITGTITACAPDSPILLGPAWNFVGPTGLTSSTPDVLYPSNVVNVWGWNETIQNWMYYSPDPEPWFESHYPQLASIDTGHGYWVELPG